MTRRADIDWTRWDVRLKRITPWLEIAAALAMLLIFAVVARGQERQRAVRPDAFIQRMRGSALYGPSSPIGTDRYLWIFISANSNVSDPKANDEIRDGLTPIQVFRVRRVIPDVAGIPPRTFFCVAMTLWIPARSGDQRVRIEPAKLILRFKDGDWIAFEHRAFWSISTSISDDGVGCDSCDWRDEKLAPGRGFAVPNGSCL